MDILSGTMAVILAVGLAVCISLIVLQVFLSRRESLWPGLILPGLAFLGSLANLLNVADIGSGTQVAAALLTVFLVGNVPTLIGLAIYFACREKLRRRRDVDRMNIQDL